MLNLLLTKTFQVTGSEDLDAHLDDVMHNLVALEGDRLCDADISATLADGVVEISIIGNSSLDDPQAALDEAMKLADSAIRSAIHAAHGHTPSWVPVGVNAEALQPA